MLVPMIATSVPGAVTVTAGAETCASTFATATAVPGTEARPRGGLLGEAARPVADRDDRRRDIFSSTTSLEARIEGGEVVAAGEPVALRPDRLVAGRAGVAGLDAGQLPDDPVGRLDQAVGAVVDLGRLVEDLQRLREEPLGRDLAAVALRARARRARPPPRSRGRPRAARRGASRA